MTVREYALRQIHFQLQRDPWVQEVFLAGGGELDELAERILAIWNQNDFEKLNASQCAYYERLLGLSRSDGASLDARRAAIQAAWLLVQKPTLKLMQDICDSWKVGACLCSYTPGVLHVLFQSDLGIPEGIDDLKKNILKAVPAHISVDWQYKYLLIRDVHEVMTIDQLAETPLHYFDFTRSGGI